MFVTTEQFIYLGFPKSVTQIEGDLFDMEKDYSLSKARREMLTNGQAHTQDETVPKRGYNHIPMFVPTDTHGNSVMHIKRRQDYLNESIGIYKEWQVAKAAAIFLAIMAVVLISRNIFVAGAFGLASGFAYGRFVWQDFYVSNNWKVRMLYEAT